MKTYAYSLVTFGSGQIRIGRQGENLATRIDVDVTPWKTEYPTGTVSLFVVPPVGNGYLAALEEDGNTIRWTIRDTDTAYDGHGKAELILKDANGTVMKSITAYTICAKSPSAEEPADPPEAIRPWVEKILEAIASGGVGSGGGAPGVGIAKLEQTTASSDDGGINVWTATLTDGSTYPFEVRNGQRGSTGPAGANGKDYVLTEADKQEIAGMVEVPGGVGAAIDDATPSATTTYSSQKIEDELSALNQAKANNADLAKVAKSGSYTDLTNKPTIPTVPTTLPNPNKLKLTGAVTAEYDGSAPVSVEIPSGGGSTYELPIASPTTLGGVKPVAKTDEMTQEVGVDAEGKLFTAAGAGGGGTGGGEETVKFELLAELQGDGESASFSQDVDIVKKGLYTMQFQVKGADTVSTGDTVYAKFGGVGVWGKGYRSAGFATTNNQYDMKGDVMLFMTNGQGKACLLSQGGSASASPGIGELDIQNKVSLYSQGSKAVYTGASMKLWRVV